MSQIEINNPLDGKRLCNALADLLVKKFEETTPGCKTEITVFNHRSFFIVNGFTTSTKTINIADLFKNYLKNFNDKMYETIKVIDIIKFVEVLVVNPLNINFNYNKNYDSIQKELCLLVDEFFNNRIKVNLKLDLKNKIMFYQANNSEPLFVEKLNLKYPEYKLIKYNFDNIEYSSDKKYGLSFGSEKLYYFLGDYISNHLFNKSISNKLEFCMYSDENFKDINSENIIFKISNNDHIVKTEWLESLVLDVFPFDSGSLLNTFTKENLETKTEELDLINELILF